MTKIKKNPNTVYLPRAEAKASDGSADLHHYAVSMTTYKHMLTIILIMTTRMCIDYNRQQSAAKNCVILRIFMIANNVPANKSFCYKYIIGSKNRF